MDPRSLLDGTGLTITGALEPLTMGQSGAGVWAVATDGGELVLRVQPEREDPTLWTQQRTLLERAAAAGVAPEIVTVIDRPDARAILSRRVAGVPLPQALAGEQRGAALAGVVLQLRALHRLDASGIGARDPLAYVRDLYAAQRTRQGFPAWAFDPVIDGLTCDERRVVSHNDVNPGNVLWDGQRAWLVDWEVAGLNHPYYDLATLAMFLDLPPAAAEGLLALQEERAVSDDDRRTLDSLRRLAALLCGLTFLSMVPDLATLPPPLPLTGVYGELRAGRLDLASPSGRGLFAQALLQLALRA